MSRRFKDIVPAMVDKAAADKNDITHGIDAAQFPDRINEDDRVTRPLPFFVAKDGAQALSLKHISEPTIQRHK